MSAGVRDPTFGSTRSTVYLNPQDLVYLRDVQRLLEHVRTEFVLTGRPPRPPAAEPTSVAIRAEQGIFDG